MLSVRCPVCPVCLSVCLPVCLSVCLSVTFVHCDQTVGRIKMKLGTQAGLGPGHFVLDGDPKLGGCAPKGHSPPILPKIGGLCPKGPQPPNFGPYLLRPNGCMDQDVTWCCLLYTSPSPRDRQKSRMPSSA